MSKIRETMLQAVSDHTHSGAPADIALFEGITAVGALSIAVAQQKGWTDEDRQFLDGITTRLGLLARAVELFGKQKRAGRN